MTREAGPRNGNPAPAKAATPDRTIPVAELIDFKPNPRAAGYWFVTIRCPHCGHRHHHGHDGDTSQPSHRAAHCRDGNTPGYYLPPLPICTGRCSSFTIDELVRIGQLHDGVCPCAKAAAS